MAQDISDHGRPSAPMYPLTGPQEWRKQRTQIRQQRYNENKLNVTEQVGGWFTAASGGTMYNGDAFPQGVRGQRLHRRCQRQPDPPRHPPPRRRHVSGAHARSRTSSSWPPPMSGSGRAISPMLPTAICI